MALSKDEGPVVGLHVSWGHCTRMSNFPPEFGGFLPGKGGRVREDVVTNPKSEAPPKKSGSLHV